MIVIEKQSLLDIAVQESGSVMAAFDWALVNGFPITETLSPGQQLNVPNSVFKNTDVADYFKGRGQMVATGFSVQEGDSMIPELGIGSMAIGTTFIVR